jgi:thiol-disulfide isomerase/thioredoxin
MRKLGLGVVLLAALSGCRSRQAVTAPDFTLKDLSGKTVHLADFRGHPVLLDFWATWCGPCRMSIPLVQKFYQDHKDQGLVVLGMNVDEDRSSVYPFVQRFQMTYPVLYAADSSMSDAFGVEGIPTFILLDAQGRIIRRYDGFSMDMPEAWAYELQRLSTAAG